MFVSIIIPVYNVENYIERCLYSVLNQTYKNLEIILIDDCSPDNSINLAEIFISESNTNCDVKIIKHPINKGLSAARNTGIIHSKGDYVFFLDSDDCISLDAIEHFVESAKEQKPDFVIGNVCKIYINQKKDDKVLCAKTKLNTNSEIFDSYLKYEWYPMACNKLVNRSFLIENNLFFKENIYHEDNLWSFILAVSASSMITCPYTTYYYYSNTNSITNNVKQKNINDLLFIYNELISISGKSRLENYPSLLVYMHNFRMKILLMSLRFGYQYWKKIYFDILKNKDIDLIDSGILPTKYQIRNKIYSLPISFVYFILIILDKKHKYQNRDLIKE